LAGFWLNCRSFKKEPYVCKDFSWKRPNTVGRLRIVAFLW